MKDMREQRDEARAEVKRLQDDLNRTLAEMRSDAALRRIPVIVISSSDEIDSIVRCIEMGATDYLAKPFNSVLLHARIRGSLASLHEERMAILREQFAQVTAAQEEERQRIARELHDGLVPILASLSIRLHTVGKRLDREEHPSAGEIKELAEQTSLGDPILQTQGVAGFELLNDALGHIAGLLAVSPFPRETWLLAMTCEDRHVVRKRCVRCFLIRPDDLRRFNDWAWCCTKVRVEKPWHWFRIVALHCIAKVWQEEQHLTRRRDATQDTSNDMPLVDKQLRHNRVQELSAGLNPEERPVGPPYTIPWTRHLPKLKQLGLPLVPPEPGPREEAATP